MRQPYAPLREEPNPASSLLITFTGTHAQQHVNKRSARRSAQQTGRLRLVGVWAYDN